jgi:hypothetical protein
VGKKIGKMKEDKILLLDPIEVKVRDGRVRKEFNQNKLDQLKHSISLVGQINPCLLDDEGFLIAGERRLRACSELGCKVKVAKKSECDPETLLLIEMHENLARDDLTPQEEVIGRARIHLFLVKKNGDPTLPGSGGVGQRLEDTAGLLGISKGQLSQDLEIHRWLPLLQELREAKTKGEMWRVIGNTKAQIQWNKEAKNLTAGAQEEMALVTQESLEENIFQIPPESPPPIPSAGNAPAKRDYLKLEPGTEKWKSFWKAHPEYQSEMLEFAKACREGTEFIPPTTLLTPSTPPPTDEEKREKDRIKAENARNLRILMFDKRLIQGNAMEKLESYDFAKLGKPGVVFFDPPWGVGLDEKQIRMESGATTYEDSEEKFVEEFPIFCKLLFDAMATDSHLYCFFGIVHFSFVYETLESVGFFVNRRPIIWVKSGIRSTMVPETWPGASYEPIAFARKGRRALVKKKGDSIINVPPLPPSQKNHISAKPPELYTDLLERSAYPGDIILDPMFGTGAAFVAAELFPLQLRWFGWELSQTNRDLALLNLANAVGGFSQVPKGGKNG